MTLAGLAFACHIYDCMEGYNSSYRRFRSDTAQGLDLRNPDHSKALLRFLNGWGCRQFARAHHRAAAQEIAEWYANDGCKLFGEAKDLLSLSNADLEQVEHMYSSLVDRPACERREKPVKIGPTGAAKILFALRPNALIPWDDPIRQELKLDGSGQAYRHYLGTAKVWLEDLSVECEKRGFNLTDLPARVGRLESSPPKLIDEYLWVTITGGYKVPSKSDFERWAEWS